jgi:L-alanine-DL-glutamate epimerase-like enolase superfamily enzyme
MSRNADPYPGRTQKLVTSARKAFGDKIVLYADANGSYDVKKGIEVGKMLQDLKYGFYEEPCPWEEGAWLKAVADALTIPMAFGEQDWSLPRWQSLIDSRAMDIVQPDLNYNGGFIRAARVARMAKKAGMKIVNHNTQTGPTAVNILQFASAIPNIGDYMEFPYRNKDQNEPWQSPHFVIKNGVIKVPTGPGLGLEIDPKFLAGARRVEA